ncbi:MAG: endonuclease domain-containing protein [Acidimicrobiales bacterium]
MKRCSKCGELRPLTDFYKAKGTRDGLRGDCRQCFQARAKARYPLVRDQAIERSRKWREDNLDRFRENQRRMRAKPEFKERARAGHLQRKYGMTLEEYDTLFSSQGGGCAICGRLPSPGTSLHIDHDHSTGRVRGLLCFRCNNSLGDLDDDPDLFEAAARYLQPTVPRHPALEARIAELIARRAG